MAIRDIPHSSERAQHIGGPQHLVDHVAPQAVCLAAAWPTRGHAIGAVDVAGAFDALAGLAEGEVGAGGGAVGPAEEVEVAVYGLLEDLAAGSGWGFEGFPGFLWGALVMCTCHENERCYHGWGIWRLAVDTGECGRMIPIYLLEVSQGRRGVEEQGTSGGHNTVHHGNSVHTKTVTDLRAYDIRGRCESDELRVRSAGDSVRCAPTVFHLECLADDTFLNLDDFVVLLVSEVAGREQLLDIIELAAVLGRNVFLGRGEEGLTGAFGRCDDRSQGRYDQDTEDETAFEVQEEHVDRDVRA